MKSAGIAAEALIAMLGLFGVLATAPLAATTADEIGGCAIGGPQNVISANPSTYRGLLDTLGPGDMLQLAAGTYPDGLPFNGHNGQPDDCIVVEGPDIWPPTAVFTVRTCCNTVSLTNSSYIVVRNIAIDGTGDIVSADGVKAQGDPVNDFAHHITLENVYIHDHDLGQQTVGISTKIPAWNWVVRSSVIENCGTGAYFGNSDGSAEFVNSLIEHNLFTDAIGYDMQIKHQNSRNTGLGIPSSGTTIIRHNVFHKGSSSSSGNDARPNLLVGHWPLSGDGADDNYLIYGNFFYQNPTGSEGLFQGEGNVIFYDNLLKNDDGPGAVIQPHNDVPKRVRVFHNTVVVDAAATGIRVSGGDVAYQQLVTGNAVFAGTPLNVSGAGSSSVDNTVDSEANSVGYLNDPLGAVGSGLDLFPLANGSLNLAMDLSLLAGEGWEDWNRDFNAAVRPASCPAPPSASCLRGAYAGEGTNPGWTLALERRPRIGPIFADDFESGDTSAWSQTVP